MAENVLRFDFLARDRNASATFQKVGKESDNLERKVGKFGTFAKVALVGVATAAGGLAAAGAVMGVKTAASLEQARIGFTTLLGSGQKAGAFLKQLTSFAAATPFELPGLVDSSRLLIGVGVNTTDTMKILQSFGDAAGAVGVGQENFQRIMLATSQAIGAGRFMTQDLNQITENGIPIWTELAKATGKPIPVLRDLASKGKLLSKDVLPILERQMNKDYGGSMAKQSQTLNGLWSTFMDTLNLGLAKAITPLLPALRVGLTNATIVAGKALQNLPGILRRITTGFQVVKKYVTGTLIPTFRTAFAGIQNSLPDINLSKFGKKFRMQAQGWAVDIIDGVRQGLDSGDWSKLGGSLGKGLSIAVTRVGDLSKVLIGLFTKIDWFEVGKQAGLAALPFGIAFISNFGSNIITVFKEHPFDFVLAVVSFLGVGKLGGAIAKVLEHVPFLRAFAPLFRGINRMTGPVNDAIGRVINFFGSAFGRGFGKVFPAIEKGLFGRVIRLADGIILRALYMREAAIRFLGGLIEGMGEMAGRIIAAAGRTIATLTRPFLRADGWLIRKGRDFIGGLLSGIRAMWAPMSSTVATTISRVTRPFASAGRWLFTEGRQLLAGLRDGMFNMAGNIGGWVSNIGGRIVRSVKNFFGIHSPSRVFGAIGSNLIQSLFGSMIDHNPIQAVHRIFGGMPQALGALVNKGIVKITSLPGKALNALAGLGGKFAGLLGGLFGGGGGKVRIGGLSGAESWIIMHESGNRTNAQNPTSTAFGLGQLLIANRRHYGSILGVSPNTTNYAAQLAMFRMYVRDRYGNAENAMRFWQAHHWYGSGALINGPRLVGVGENGSERILSHRQTQSFERLVGMLDRRPNMAEMGARDPAIDYHRLGDAVARAFMDAGVTVKMDGRAVGTIMGKQADLLGRAS